MSENQIVEAVREAFRRAQAPIVHIHDKDGQIFATIFNAVALGQIEVRGPVSDEAKQEFWLHHGYITIDARKDK